LEIELNCGLPLGALRETAFERELLNDAVTGRITDEVWRESVATLLALKHPDAKIAQAVTAWSLPLGDVDENVLRLVQLAGKRIKVVLVTNGTSRLNRDLEVLGLLPSLDVVVNSSVIGVAKPAHDFYVAALRLAGVDAAEALFVDDSPSHVEAAVQLEICSLRFTGHEALATFLQNHRAIG